MAFSQNVFTMVFAFSSLFLSSQAGNCWQSVGENGRCQGLVRAFTSKEDCCSMSGSSSTTLAYTDDHLDSGALFRYNALLGGAPNCQPCRKTCEGVTCGENKACQMQNGRPKCVCKPNCEGLPSTRVCGSDGKTYRNHCALLQNNCHYGKRVRLNYYGKCRNTCERVTCPAGTSCILDDHNRRTHCVRCATSCPTGIPSEPLCGADGVTYDNDCELRAAGCRKQKSVTIAYRGPCQAFATCQNLTCPNSAHKCLTNPTTGLPQCERCNIQCPHAGQVLASPVCATNGVTYTNWCALRRAGCAKGIVLETRHSGRCGSGAGSDDAESASTITTSSSSSSSSPTTTERKFVSFHFGKAGRKFGGSKSRFLSKSGLRKNKKKLSKKERRARRRMQRRQRLQAKAALLAESRRNKNSIKNRKKSSSSVLSRRPTGAKPFKHPQSSLAVKRAAPSN